MTGLYFRALKICSFHCLRIQTRHIYWKKGPKGGILMQNPRSTQNTSLAATSFCNSDFVVPEQSLEQGP